MFYRPISSRAARLLARLALVAVFAMTGPAAAITSELPSLGENSKINIERETSLGRSVYERLMASGLIETDPLLDRYINDLGFRLLAGLDNRVRDYRFFIVNDNSVNAFALPGGFIGVNLGLIHYARSQHQLASVLAHEISHVRLMHGMDMLRKGSEVNTATLLAMLAGLLLGGVDSQLGTAVLYGGVAGGQQSMVNFTRENEYEADRMGIELLNDAGFDTNGMVEFFTIMSRLSGSSEIGNIEYLRTHPLDSNRIAEAANRAANFKHGSNQVDDYGLFKDYLLYVSKDHLPDEGSDYLRALAAMKSAQYLRADHMLEALYRANDENIWYSVAYAENLQYLQRVGDAEAVYRHLLRIFPGDYAVSMRLLRLLSQADRYPEALEIARRLENDHPQEQSVYFALSEIYKSLQQPALQLMAEAEFHRLNGNIQQSIRLYDQVLKLDGVDSTTLLKAREKRLQLLERQ
jgi:predicted Zn-dependent protease